MIAIGLVVMAVGAALVGLFVHVILNVQPVWFPGEAAARGGAIAPHGPAPMSHTLFGVLVAALFFGGVALFSLGSAMVGTTMGYGHG